MERDDDTLDKGKRYHKRWNRIDCRCCDMGRRTRSHVPLIKMVFEMKFLDNLLHHNNSQASFSSISGYDDLKNIINRVLLSEENFKLLLVGPLAGKLSGDL